MIIGILKIIGIILILYTVKSMYTNRINRRWRKSSKIGDRCFFINLFNGRSYGFITAYNEDLDTVCLEQRTDGLRTGKKEASGWYNLENLRIK